MRTYRIVVIALSLLTFTVGLFVIGTRAEAATITANTVIVRESLNGTWDSALRTSLSAVDRYTGETRMVIGKCDSRHRCITFRYGNPPGNLVGWCSPCGIRSGEDIITVYKGYGNSTTRRHLLTHETAHAFGVGHNSKPISVMYKDMKYNGKLTPYTFTKTELAILKRY